MKKIIIIICSLFLVSCASSFLPLDLNSSFPSCGYKIIGPTDGETCLNYILSVPLSGDASYKTAVQKALEKTGGDVLVNVFEEQYYKHYYVYYKRCTRVSGIAVKLVN